MTSVQYQVGSKIYNQHLRLHVPVELHASYVRLCGPERNQALSEQIKIHRPSSTRQWIDIVPEAPNYPTASISVHRNVTPVALHLEQTHPVNTYGQGSLAAKHTVLGYEEYFCNHPSKRTLHQECKPAPPSGQPNMTAFTMHCFPLT